MLLLYLNSEKSVFVIKSAFFRFQTDFINNTGGRTNVRRLKEYIIFRLKEW